MKNALDKLDAGRTELLTYPRLQFFGWFFTLTYVPLLYAFIRSQNSSCYGADNVWLVLTYIGFFVFGVLFYAVGKIRCRNIQISDFTPYFAGLILTLELFAISIAAHHGWHF